MRLGIIGLGKMGMQVAERLKEKGHEVIAFDLNPESINALTKKGIIPATNFADLAQKLGNPKIVLLLVPAGESVNEVIEGITPFLEKEDIVIDAGNSFYKDSMVRAEAFQKKGIFFLDVGVSGGIEGARNGASVMVGGESVAFQKIEPLFQDMAAKNGYAHVGVSGAGHFVKMIHNGIEYSMLQSIGEGFLLLEKSPFNLDLRAMARVYQHGSIIQGRLMECLLHALSKDAHLEKQPGIIGSNGTGEWAFNTGKEMHIPTPLLEEALRARKESFSKPNFATKIVAAIRYEFGGHVPPTPTKKQEQ